VQVCLNGATVNQARPSGSGQLHQLTPGLSPSDLTGPAAVNPSFSGVSPEFTFWDQPVRQAAPVTPAGSGEALENRNAAQHSASEISGSDEWPRRVHRGGATSTRLKAWRRFRQETQSSVSGKSHLATLLDRRAGLSMQQCRAWTPHLVGSTSPDR